MNCPQCNGKTAVTESKTVGDIVIRLRRCKLCGNKFQTSEHIDNSEETSEKRKLIYKQRRVNG